MNIESLFNQLYWHQPAFLWLLVLPFLIYLWQTNSQQRKWLKIADAKLLPWLKVNSKSQTSPFSLVILVLIWVLMVIALAGPRSILQYPKQKLPPTDSLLIILDLSASMNAEDETPNRKQRAISFIQNTINNQPEHLNIGLIAYAGHSFSVLLPTNDNHLAKHFGSSLNSLILPTLGNNLSSAIELAIKQLDQYQTNQHLLILTDGDITQTEQQKVVSLLKQTTNNSDINITFIGLGATQAVKITNSSNEQILENGRPVLSKLHQPWFLSLQQTQIKYRHMNDTKQQSLQQLIGLQYSTLSKNQQALAEWNEWFNYPLFIALFLLLSQLWLSNSKKITKASAHLLFTVFTLPYLFSNSVEASNLEQARQALNNGQYQQAKELFSQHDYLESIFGKGIACYRLAEFKCAVSAFSKVAWQSRNQEGLKKLQKNAVFNLANSYFYLAEYEQATVLYQDAINLGFDEKTATKNMQFSLSLHAALKRQIKDIKKTYQRAKWRAAMLGEQQPNLSDIIGSNRYIRQPTNNKTNSATFQQRQAIALIISNALADKNKQNQNTVTTRWVKTEQVPAQTTSTMLKRLFELELSLPASLKQPQSIKGQREW